MSVRLWTKWLWVRVQLQSLKFQNFAPASSKEFLDIQATIECGFTLKCVHDTIRTYNQMHRTDKYSQHSSIIWPVWLNGWVFVYELNGCGFESSCSHLKVRYISQHLNNPSWFHINCRLSLCEVQYQVWWGFVVSKCPCTS